MYRFFTENIPDEKGIIVIDGPDHNHLKNSLRIRISEKIQIVSNDIIYDVEISEILEDCIKTKIINIDEKSYESPLSIHLYQGYCKGDKMDFIIQKAVELGVDEITPLLTNRTVVKIKEGKAQSKIKRFEKIIEEAAKQSKRKNIPIIHPPLSLGQLEVQDEYTIVAYEEEEESLKTILETDSINSVNVIIGPEGGFEKEEIEKLQGMGARSVSIGNRILRAETAALALLSILQYEKGDLN